MDDLDIPIGMQAMAQTDTNLRETKKIPRKTLKKQEKLRKTPYRLSPTTYHLRTSIINPLIYTTTKKHPLVENDWKTWTSP